MKTEEVRELFRQQFGAAPDIIALAPGRVNLIGEHTDYNSGFVFPAAIDRGLWLAASAVAGPSQVTSDARGDGPEFDVNSVEPGEKMGWAGYAAGMAWAMRGEGTIPNVNAALTSTIPIGSGVSSSAALELAFGVLWNELAGLGLSKNQLAKAGQRCENQFVGVNSGIMDQMAVANGRAGKAMFLDTANLEIEFAPIPSDWVVVLCDTQTPRTLAASAYNERRAQCEAACAELGISVLRDANASDLTRIGDPLVRKRATHVVTENDRCLKFRDALATSATSEVGELMRASHISLRDDYAVSCAELDAMAESAWKAPGCIGARMTGAGFGGVCVALVLKDRAEDFVESTLEGFQRICGKGGTAMTCAVAEGARIVWRADK